MLQPELSCQDFDALVLGYLVDTLAPAERARFEAHRAACDACRAHFAWLEAGAHFTCQRLVELVTDYLEDRLAPAERARFEAHLRLCPPCVTYLDQLQQTVRLTGKLREEHLAPAARRALLAAFRDWQR